MPYLEKRSVSLAGHSTSVALEPAFWAELELMARVRGISLGGLLIAIDEGRGGRPLASSCRLTVLETLKRNAESATLSG